MQLLLSAAKPHATPRAQLLWLVDLLQAQERPVEAPRFGLTPSWSGHLHVIQADYAHRNRRLTDDPLPLAPWWPDCG